MTACFSTHGYSRTDTVAVAFMDMQYNIALHNSYVLKLVVSNSSTPVCGLQFWENCVLIVAILA